MVPRNSLRIYRDRLLFDNFAAWGCMGRLILSLFHVRLRICMLWLLNHLHNLCFRMMLNNPLDEIMKNLLVNRGLVYTGLRVLQLLRRPNMNHIDLDF